MKRSRVITAAIASLLSCGISAAIAAPQPDQPGTSPAKTPYRNPGMQIKGCAQGWTMKFENADGTYECVPKVPGAQQKCPEGTVPFKTPCSYGCKKEAILE